MLWGLNVLVKDGKTLRETKMNENLFEALVQG